MTFADDLAAVLLGTATLLLLSLYTLINCRTKLTRPAASYAEFLFDARSRIYCLAGTVGYAFSITYFGAVIIYGYLYRFWFVALLSVVGGIALLLIRRIILRAPACSVAEAPSKHNLILELLQTKLGRDNAKHIADIYLVIYFALLVEELAVSRVALNLLFPNHRLITPVLLATICVTVLTYTKWGGFRAILTADFEQLKLLLPFALAVGFLIYENASGPTVQVFAEPEVRADTSAAAVVGAISLGVAWIAASVDFYSRLNFAVDKHASVSRERCAFALLAVLLTASVFTLAIVYGISLPAGFGREPTPEGFMRMGFEYVLTTGSTATRVVVFASIFCMIFTTLSTLLLTIFQVGYYRRDRWPRIREIHKVLLWAILLSAPLHANLLSAIGLAVAALMVLPLAGILASVSTLTRSALPRNFRFLKAACALAVAIFLWGLPQFVTNYSVMPAAGAVALASLILCGVAAKLLERFQRVGP